MPLPPTERASVGPDDGQLRLLDNCPNMEGRHGMVRGSLVRAGVPFFGRVHGRLTTASIAHGNAVLTSSKRSPIYSSDSVIRLSDSCVPGANLDP